MCRKGEVLSSWELEIRVVSGKSLRVWKVVEDETEMCDCWRFEEQKVSSIYTFLRTSAICGGGSRHATMSWTITERSPR